MSTTEPAVPFSEPVPAARADAAPTPAPMHRRTRTELAALLVSASVIFALDHLTKYLVSEHLSLFQEYPPGGLVVLRHVENSGAAFGLFPGFRWFYLIIASAFGIGVLVAGNRLGRGRYRQAVWGVVLGGALSNGIDRLLFGQVTDFIDLRHWPVFNVADSAIVVGILIAILTFRPQQPPGPAAESEA